MTITYKITQRHQPKIFKEYFHPKKTSWKQQITHETNF